MKKSALALFICSVVGCGTNLTVVEVDRIPSLPPDAKPAPCTLEFDGVVVNQRATYQGQVRINRESFGKLVGMDDKEIKYGNVSTQEKEAMKFKLAGIDHFKMLLVNISRMAFASGKLSLVLDENQVIKESGITSKTLIPEAANAANAVVNTRKKIQKDNEKNE